MVGCSGDCTCLLSVSCGQLPQLLRVISTLLALQGQLFTYYGCCYYEFNHNDTLSLLQPADVVRTLFSSSWCSLTLRNPTVGLLNRPRIDGVLNITDFADGCVLLIGDPCCFTPTLWHSSVIMCDMISIDAYIPSYIRRCSFIFSCYFFFFDNGTCGDH